MSCCIGDRNTAVAARLTLNLTYLLGMYESVYYIENKRSLKTGFKINYMLAPEKRAVWDVLKKYKTQANAKILRYYNLNLRL